MTTICGGCAPCPEPTQRLMLLAAADPTGDATLLWRAGRTLGLGQREAAAAARSSWSRSAPGCGSGIPWCARRPTRPARRRSAARRTGRSPRRPTPDADPERRMWHQAAAATEPDEAVAAELEQAAARIQARAGLAAAAAFLQRSAALTAEPGRRADRALAAALANLHAGAFDTARGLLAAGRVRRGRRPAAGPGRAARGQIEWASVAGREAPVLLRQAASRLETLESGSPGRPTSTPGWRPVAGPAGRTRRPSPRGLPRRARGPAPPTPEPYDLLLDGLTTMVTYGRAAAAPALRRGGGRLPRDQVSARGVAAMGRRSPRWPPWPLWDFDSWAALSTRHVELARAAGALGPVVHRAERPADGGHAVRRLRDGDVAGARRRTWSTR